MHTTAAWGSNLASFLPGLSLAKTYGRRGSLIDQVQPVRVRGDPTDRLDRTRLGNGRSSASQRPHNHLISSHSRGTFRRRPMYVQSPLSPSWTPKNKPACYHISSCRSRTHSLWHGGLQITGKPTAGDGAQHLATRPSCHQRATLSVSPARACRRKDNTQTCSRLQVGSSSWNRTLVSQNSPGPWCSKPSTWFPNLAAAVESEAHQISEYRPQGEDETRDQLGQTRSRSKGKLSEWLTAPPWLPRSFQGPGRLLLLRWRLLVSGKEDAGCKIPVRLLAAPRARSKHETASRGGEGVGGQAASRPLAIDYLLGALPR